MKTLLIVPMLAATMSIAPAQEKKTLGEKTSEAVDRTKEAAKDAGHAIADKTKQAAEVVKDAVTPDKDARKVEVRLIDGKIEIPKMADAGKTAFVVTNAGTKKHNFRVEGQGIDKKFITSVDPNETKTLHVDLKMGNYKVSCPVGDHEDHGMKMELTVK
jgi:uncharacterized cupredoxin-like copper-binding protein